MLNAWDFGYNFQAQNNVTPALNTINQGLDKLGQNTQEESAKVQKSFFEMENAAKVAAKGIAAIDAMKGMKQDFADFEYGMAEASTLLKGASVDMSEYEAKVISLSAKYGELPAELTKSLYTAISSGFTSVSESGILMEKSLELAVGGATTAAQAMDGLTTIMHAWGFTVKDLDRIGDTLFIGMREGKTTIGELTAEIGQIASFAKQAGQSLEEMTAAASALTLGGRTTSEAMNGLRSILTEVMRQEPGVMKTVEELEKASGMKLDFNVKGLEKKGLGQFLFDLRKAVEIAGSDTGIARVFGRIQGMSAVLSMTGPQAEKFLDIFKKMKEESGVTGDAVGKMMNTSILDQRKYEASVKIMRIQVGRALSPILSVIRIIKQGFVDFFTTIARRAPWLIQLGGALLLVGATIAIVIAKVIALKATFALIMVFGKMVVGMLVAGFSALAPVILPVAAAIAAVVAVLYVLKKAYDENWSGFADGVDLVTQSVYHLFSALKQLALTGEITGATAEFLIMHETLYSIVQALWYVGTATAWLVGGMVAGFMAVSDILEPVKGQFEAIALMFERIGKIFVDTLGELGLMESSVITPMKVLGAIGYGVGMTVAFALRAVVAVLSLVVTAFGAAAGVIAAAFLGVWRIIRGIIRVFTGDFSGGLAEMILAVVQFGASLLAVVWGIVDSVAFAFLSMFGVQRETWDAFLTEFGEYFATLGRGMLYVLNGVWEGWKWIFGKIYDYYAWVLGGMKSLWDGFAWAMGVVWAYTIGGLIQELSFLGVAFEIVAKFLKAIWEPVVKWFEDKLGWIRDMANELKDLVGGIGDAISTVGGGVQSLGSKLSSGLSSIGTSLFGGGDVSTANMLDWSFPGLAPGAGTKTPVAGSVSPGSVVGPSGATVRSGGSVAPAQGKAPVIQTIIPPGKATINVDGRVLAEAVMTHADARKEESMRPVIPVWSGFGGQ